VDRHRQPASVTATVVDRNAEGHRRILFAGVNDLCGVLEELGETPLPHYIKREGDIPGIDDHERYQTVYAQNKGSVAAPTAGLHFTNELLGQIRSRGIEVCSVTLHVGPGTFAPVKTELIENHTMHHERFYVGEEAARIINAARSTRRRVIAVGTTTVRVLESLARDHQGRIVAGMGRTNIFIFPPFEFRIVDALVTNFHLPRSTLLMLISAFAAPGKLEGREKILAAYEEAVKQHYRFFSYGDAMLIA
jgi:S-adenosylmethionine:tRNA ribosyltransferase-isomerase